MAAAVAAAPPPPGGSTGERMSIQIMCRPLTSGVSLWASYIHPTSLDSSKNIVALCCRSLTERHSGSAPLSSSYIVFHQIDSSQWHSELVLTACTWQGKCSCQCLCPSDSD